MQEAEEQDTCRICSAPGEPGQPLFYPCKCSGTIRYIHQDCLTTWLSHSKKKTCDVCKHPYSFTKVYATDMPSSLPPLLLIRRLAQQAFFASLFGLRAIVIAIVWLAFLPWITIWTWRVYFTMGESTAWWISGRERPVDVRPIGIVQALTVSNETVSSLKNVTIPQRFASRAFWQALSSDIFAGQIIASLIVLVFVAVFLLREWISQNARPGVFEEDEIAGVPAQDPAPAPPPPANQPVQNINARLAVPLRQDPLDDGDLPIDALRRGFPYRRPRRPVPQNPPPVDALRQQPAELNRLEPDFTHEHQNPPFNPSLYPQTLAKVREESETPLVDAGKGKEKEDAAISSLSLRRRVHRRFEDGGDNEDTEHITDASSFSFNSPEFASSSSSAGPVPGRSTAIDVTPFEFTFTIPSNTNMESDIREPVPEMPARSLVALQTAMMSGTPIPEEVPRRRSIVFLPEVPSRTPSPPPAAPVGGGLDVRASQELSSSVSSEPSFIHVPMSSSSFGAEDSLAASPGHFAVHTTYGYPSEVLEIGSSSSSAVDMNLRKRVRDETEEEYDHYFRDPGPVTLNPADACNDVVDVGPKVAEGGEHHYVAEGEEPPLPGAVPDDEDDSEDDEAQERIFWDADADRDDEEDDDVDAVDIGNLNIPNRPGAQDQAQPPPQAPVQQANEGVEDLEAGVEDDMEGALEAIGLRGPVLGLVQNVILMVFVLDTAIGFGIWLPFTLGKTVALLSLDPQRALYILHLPILGMRIVTDPFVDFFTLILGHFFFPFLHKTSRFLLSSVFGLVSYFTSTLVPTSTQPAESHEVTSWLVSKKSQLSAVVSLWMQSPPQESRPDLSQKLNDFFESNSTAAQLLEPRFAYIGREVRLIFDNFQRSWVGLALGHGSGERAFAIVLGYTVIGIVLALYLNVFTVGNARTAGRAVRNAVRQQLLVVKVAMFIVIELIVFPLGCGIMLDACTIWVFPDASLKSRIAFFTQAPLTAMFYHWVAGTMFMYQFAVLLGGCRNIMRPGAMWFIKDPQDQNYHPIRDILDRPTFTQFRKLLISAFMYAMVVACGVGSLAILLFIGNRSIFPIRWKTREPLSEVPIDLLFLQIVLPYTMRYLRPRKVVYRVAVHAWKFLAAELRLTSYMFGERHREQESSRVYKTWRAFLRRSARDSEEVTTTRDGAFRRVPASDNIALPRDMRATAEVFEDGTPLNARAAALVTSQNAEAIKAKRDVKEDYIVVYFPPQFRMRIIAFVMAVWTIMAFVAAVCIAVPVQVGRHFFALISSASVHDGYSFLAGFYILWACYLIGKAAESMERRRQRVTRDGPRADFAVYFAKQSLLWLAKITYLAVFLGIVLPILLGLVVDLYVVLPIRLTLYPKMVPTIRLVDMWSLGLVYCKIVIRLRRRLQLPQRRYNALHMLLSNGWAHPDPRHATKELILPVLASLFAMLLLPAGTVYALRELLHVPLSKKFLLMHVYPGIFAVVGLSRFVITAMSVLSTWSQSIRDKEFLVEMRLQNLETEDKSEQKGEGKGTRTEETHAATPVEVARANRAAMEPEERQQ